MTSLPSFVELMESLGLNNEPRSQGRASFSSVSSASSASSIGRASSTLSTPQTSPAFYPPPSPTRSLDAAHYNKSLGRKRAARYSPYMTENLHLRRGSLPAIQIDHFDEPDYGMRSAPASPHTVGPVRTQHENKRPSPERSDDSDVPCARISTIRRRRTPQSSPHAATFPHRRPSQSPDTLMSPVALPTLPSALLASMSPSTPVTDASGASLPFPDQSMRVPLIARRRAVGLRISTYRSSTVEPRRVNHVSPPSPLRSAS